jgi:hypothetical protein
MFDCISNPSMVFTDRLLYWSNWVQNLQFWRVFVCLRMFSRGLPCFRMLPHVFAWFSMYIYIYIIIIIYIYIYIYVYIYTYHSPFVHRKLYFARPRWPQALSGWYRVAKRMTSRSWGRLMIDSEGVQGQGAFARRCVGDTYVDIACLNVHRMTQSRSSIVPMPRQPPAEPPHQAPPPPQYQ